MRSFSPDLLLPIYALGIIGAFLQIAGAQWDVSWHILGIVETFLQPAHFVLYAGIGSTAIAALFGLRYAMKYESVPFRKIFSYVLLGTRNNQPYTKLLTGVRIAAVGVGIQLLAGPFDFYWHSIYGFDPFLFTPAHSLLITGLLLGGAGMFLGNLRLLQAQREGFKIASSGRTLPFLVVLGLATIWLIMNFAGYWITDLHGMAYSFGYCSINQFHLFGGNSCGFVNNDINRLISDLLSSGVFAGSGVLTFLAARTIFARKGMITLSTTISATVYSLVALGFMSYVLLYLGPPGTYYLTDPSVQKGMTIGSFIPVYLLSLVPMILFDLLSPVRMTNRTFWALSAMLGPFSALVDARYASTLADNLGRSAVGTLILIVPPEIVGGILAALIFTKLKRKLTVVPVTPIAIPLVTAREGLMQ